MEEPRRRAGLRVFRHGGVDMNVLQVRLRDFRNHADSMLEFGPGLNVLAGDNGQGKTNVLEAVSYLSLTKSFYATGDAAVLRHGCGAFIVEGVLQSDNGAQSTVAVQFDGAMSTKSVAINGLRPESLGSVIGRFPVVVLSPENNAVTFGGPADRRRFVDLVLSQLSRPYFQDLLEYRRGLRQRNRLLVEGGAGRTGDGLDPWDAALARTGSRIIHRRRQFVREFLTYLDEAYRSLTGESERPALEYRSVGGTNASTTQEEIRNLMELALRKSRAEDLRRNATQVGPHRDEFRFLLNGTSVQLYASQGQHKTLLVALKVAEFRFLRERLGERPVFLLDDVFSELDGHRARRILDLVLELGQALITTTDARIFEGRLTTNTANRLFEVDHGTVRAA
jgi:DNA replication and repair protein RecF